MCVGALAAALFATAQAWNPKKDKDLLNPGRTFFKRFLVQLVFSLVGTVFVGIFTCPCNPATAAMTGLTGSGMAWILWKSSTIRSILRLG
jgi:hypothetical protein